MRLSRILRQIESDTQQGARLVEEFRKLHVLPTCNADEYSVAARLVRSEDAFGLIGRYQKHLDSLEPYRTDSRAVQMRRKLQCGIRALHRINRESPIAQKPGSPVIPAGDYKNFLRDGFERMYFLALHPFPSAYDFFCTTYVEAPLGYRQELHFHRRSEELTLVLDGQADCVWMHPAASGWSEAGRVTASAGQAFRIPPRVVHTINNPVSENRNVTIKLTMFIDDRVGQNESAFDPRNIANKPVMVDSGRRRNTGCGTVIRYQHAYQGLKFVYRIETISPAKSLTLPREDRFLFLFAGEVTLNGIGQARSPCVLHVSNRKQALLANLGSTDARLFSVEGLDFQKFADNPDSYAQFPRWCVRPALNA